MTANDAFLYYNVGEWAKFGLAVPNGSDDIQSQNHTIRKFIEEVGRNLQGIMFHADSRLRVPPSINTIRRIHKLCVRARTLLAYRAVAPGTSNMEPSHALPAPEQFLVYPTPYFKVRNPWLKEYCGLILLALTEAMQHTENARPIEISENFSGLIGQYVQRVYRSVATELLQIPMAEASKPDFTLTDEQLAAYNPAKWFTQTEMIDTVPSLIDWPTEDSLSILTDGIPISQLPDLGRYPGSIPGGQLAGAPSSAAEANTAFTAPPSA